jgi:uncharacterized protein YbbC (DUF1343 family)
MALKRIAFAQLKALPGRDFHYSDLGFIALGEVIRSTSGERLDVFARKNIFEPLKMKETRFLPPPGLRERAAPTEKRDVHWLPEEKRWAKGEERWIRGVVHDPRAYRLGGVAGNAGLFSTAADLARFARMMLGMGQLDGVRVLTRRSVEAMTTPRLLGKLERARGLGWDIRSGRSANRGELLSPRAYGHGGFTGTSLFIDPELDLFVLFLSNRVHPDGTGRANRLAGSIADAAVAALEKSRGGARCAGVTGKVETGIDVLRESGFGLLRGRRVGLVTNATGRARDGTRTADLLHAAREVTLVALFSPEHGLGAGGEWKAEDGRDPSTGATVHSLFGPVRRPTAEMLEGIDTLVFDIQDAGVRYFTYMSTLVRVMEAAREHGLEVVVLDRPNPLGGVRVEGPLLDSDIETFVNYHPLPVRHGMTAGELAGLLNAERKIDADLHVVRMRGWRRTDYFDETGLPWVNPSPNLRSPAQAVLYPCVGLLESTNLSVGRGTDSPFEVLGAPWIDSGALAAAVAGEDLPGVTFVPVEFTPLTSRYRGEICRGLRLTVVDRDRFRPVRTALAIARHLRKLHAGRWSFWDLQKMVGSRETMQALVQGRTFLQIERLWEKDLQRFLTRREPFLLYPRCPER